MDMFCRIFFLQKFCCDGCFKKSNCYGDQLESSPLWMRERGHRTEIKFWHEADNL